MTVPPGGLGLPDVPPATPETWPVVRDELVEALAEHVYGRTPRPAWTSRVEAIERAAPRTLGPGTRTQLRLTFDDGAARRTMTVLLLLPGTPAETAPVVLGLNFDGNHTAVRDPEVALPAGWVPDRAEPATDAHRTSDGGRGAAEAAWAADRLLAAGVGVATLYAGDAEPDHPAGHVEGVRALAAPGADPPWGALGVWAWALSRAREAVAREPGVRPDAIVAVGHSRMGKAALWAAAQDEGFAAVVSNGSGCGGASLTRHHSGEGIADITRAFPHWFTPGFAAFAGREEELPVDQHFLLAATAPRPLYVASAADDHWADPVGELLATTCAHEVHRAVGGGAVGHHLRPGGHAITAEDWEHVLVFLRRHVPGFGGAGR